MKNKLYAFWFGVSVIIGCDGRINDSILDRSQVTRIYTEILREHSRRHPAVADSSTADSLSQVIAESKGTTLAKLKTTIEFYKKDSQYWKEFYYEVIKNIEAEERKNLPQPDL